MRAFAYGLALLLVLGLLISRDALAGPNAGGVLVVHTDDAVPYSAGQWYVGESGFDCGPVEPCPDLGGQSECLARLAGLNSTSGLDGLAAPVLWWVLAAFPADVCPDVSGVVFGMAWDQFNALRFVDWGHTAFLEQAAEGWPSVHAGQGTALVFAEARHEQVFEVYWFAAYAYAPTEVQLTEWAQWGGARFGDSSIVPRLDRIAGLGRLGLNGFLGQNALPGEGACCLLDGTCVPLEAARCAMVGGEPVPGAPCEPDPCSHFVFVLRADGGGDFPDIQEAIDSAEDWDVIELEDGIYTGPRNSGLDLQGKLITIRSRSGNPEACVISCDGRFGFRLENREDYRTRIEGVTIRGASQGIVFGLTSGGTVVDCIVEDSIIDGVYCVGYSDPVFEGCVIRNNDRGIQVRSGANPIFRECRVEGNQNDGATLIVGGGPVLFEDTVFSGNYTTGQGAGIAAVDTPVTLRKCTVAENRGGSGTGGVYSADGVVRLENSIVWGNCGVGYPDGAADIGGTLEFTCACVNPSRVGAIDGNIEYLGDQVFADPEFCAPVGCAVAGGDYSLRRGSPCLASDFTEIGDCGRIGALGAGCGSDPVPSSSIPIPAFAPSLTVLPNPALASVEIRWQLPRFSGRGNAGSSGDTSVVLEVFSPQGRRVWRHEDSSPANGGGIAMWDGLDERGQRLASGVYFVRCTGPELVVNGNVTLVR